MATTYDKIATTTLSTNGSISFTSIPSTYTDLRLVLVGTLASGVNSFRFNNDSTALYSFTIVAGNGTAASSGRATAQTEFAVANTTFSGTVPQLVTIDIFSYAGSTFKTCLIEDSQDFNGSGNVERQVGLYRSTTAISRIDFQATYKTGTSVTLYGILKA
jgi:hypothetical protein